MPWSDCMAAKVNMSLLCSDVTDCYSLDMTQINLEHFHGEISTLQVGNSFLFFPQNRAHQETVCKEFQTIFQKK